jgi:hypothetical protein
VFVCCFSLLCNFRARQTYRTCIYSPDKLTVSRWCFPARYLAALLCDLMQPALFWVKLWQYKQAHMSC